MKNMKKLKTGILLLILSGLIPAGSAASRAVAAAGGNTAQRNDPPGERDSAPLTGIKYTSNADTLFLSWEPPADSTDFDRYLISADRPGTETTAGRHEKACYLTQIPGNEPVSIRIRLLRNGKEVRKHTVNATIDGLDKSFAASLIPDSGSVTGGDGTCSIALPDGRSIFLMGDSFTGPVTDGARSPSDHMFRNTYIIRDNGQVSAIYGVNGEKSSAAVPPGVTDEHQKWYWPGHGFVKNGKLYIFQTLMYREEPGMWGFRYAATDILEYDLPGLELRRTAPIPFRGAGNIHYGMAALDDGQYIYIYAQEDTDNGPHPVSGALVARTVIDSLFSGWEYFDGTAWSPRPTDAAQMDGLSGVAISSQFSVFKIEDKYVLLTQEKRFNSGEIYTHIADSPQGPWYNRQLIYSIPPPENPQLFTYNAMAHPQFRKGGMILVSYNVNNEDFGGQYRDVSSYRPRFFWVRIGRILSMK